MKKAKQHPDVIRIGRNRSIKLIDVRGRTDHATNIDSLVEPMETFWRLLEVNCVSECCGVNAHSFLPQDIWNAMRESNDRELSQKLEKLRSHIDTVEPECVVSNILNQYFDRSVFTQLLDHVIATIDGT